MDSKINNFVNFYELIHGPLVLSLCFFGILSNLVNIRVLMQRHMITPTNVLLCGLSSSQLLLLINYCIYTLYVILDTPCNETTKTFAWLSYILLNVNLNLVFHTISLVHTTMLAIFRYAAVAYPVKCQNFISVKNAKNVVIIAFVGVPIVCCTFYPNSIVAQKDTAAFNSTVCSGNGSVARVSQGFDHYIVDPGYGHATVRSALNYATVRHGLYYNATVRPGPSHNGTVHPGIDPNATICSGMMAFPTIVCPWSAGSVLYELRYSDRKTLRDYNFWFFSTVCKILPCLLLVILSSFLIRELSLVRHRRLRLAKQTSEKITASERHHRQVTIMLICIVLLFVIVELPQGAMNMLSAILKDDFIDIYTSLGDFFEMLTVLYSSVNFILYCSMSSQFRSTFKVVFLKPIFRSLGCRQLATSMTSNERHLSKATIIVDQTPIREYSQNNLNMSLLDTAM